MSRLAKAIADWQAETAKRKAVLDAEYQSWEEKLRVTKQHGETQRQAVLEEQNKVSAASAQIPKLQQEVAHAEAEAEEINQAAQLAKAETKILETAEQKIFTKLRDAVAYLRQSEMETEKLLADVKVVCTPVQDQAMLSAGTNDMNGNMAMGPSTWMSLRMPPQAHPAECSTAGALVPCLSNQDPLAAAQAVNSLGSPADMAAMLEDTEPQTHSLPSVSQSEAEALGARGTLAQPLLPESMNQLGYSESPRLAYSGDGGSNQTMQIPMLAGESSPAAPGSSRSPVQNFSTLVPHSHPPRARPQAQAQQPGQPSSFSQPSSRLGRPGHGAGRAQPQSSQPQPLTYSFFPTDSIFNPGARGTSVASSQAALSNGEGAPSFMPMGTGFGNDRVLSPRHQSPSMHHQQQQQQQHHHSPLNGHLQQQQQQLPHAAAQVRSPTTSQSQPFFLNGHLHQPAAHFQQQQPQPQLGGPQGSMPQSGPRSPMQQSQQQAVTGPQRLQSQQQPQQQQQQRPQPMQQQQPVVHSGGPEAAGLGSPQPQQPQQQQQPARAASTDSHQLPGQSALGSQPSGLKVVIPMAGRNRSEGQAPTDGRAQPGSATSEPSSTTQTQSGSAKLGASGPQPKLGGQRAKKKRKTDTKASKA